MRIHSRLIRLERVARERTAPGPDHLVAPLTDDEEADRTGGFLWLTTDWDGHNRLLARNPRTADNATAFRAWDLAAKEARAAGHTAYYAGLRTQAMAIWLAMKPGLLEHVRTYGVWVPIGDPVRADKLTLEEFERLPLAERVAVLREHRPGYSSKLGREACPERRLLHRRA